MFVCFILFNWNKSSNLQFSQFNHFLQFCLRIVQFKMQCNTCIENAKMRIHFSCIRHIHHALNALRVRCPVQDFYDRVLYAMHTLVGTCRYYYYY